MNDIYEDYDKLEHYDEHGYDDDYYELSPASGSSGARPPLKRTRYSKTVEDTPRVAVALAVAAASGGDDASLRMTESDSHEHIFV